MSKIEKLNEWNEKYKALLEKQAKVHEELAKKMIETFEEYQLVLEWHFENDHYIDTYGVGRMDRGKFQLAYDDLEGILYCWDYTEGNRIIQIDLKNNDLKSVNPIVFIKRGFFKEAMNNINYLNRYIVEIVEENERELKELENLLK